MMRRLTVCTKQQSKDIPSASRCSNLPTAWLCRKIFRQRWVKPFRSFPRSRREKLRQSRVLDSHASLQSLIRKSLHGACNAGDALPSSRENRGNEAIALVGCVRTKKRLALIFQSPAFEFYSRLGAAR